MMANDSNSSYNTRNPAVRRLLQEARELQNPTDQFWAAPLEDNLFEWHFTIAGPSASDFENGLYHGRIILPANYPLQPPSFMFVTHNGRFETNRKICLSISGHHPETWQPSWSIRTALVALVAFLPTPGGGAIGSLDYSTDERKKLASKSRTFSCSNCGMVSSHLLKSSPVIENVVKEEPEKAKEEPSTSQNNESENSTKKETTENVQENESTAQSSQGPQQTASSSTPFPQFAFPNLASATNGVFPVGVVPPPYAAATYLPYLYQTMFGFASYYASQAALASVAAGAVANNQLLGGNQNLLQNINRQQQQQQQQQQPQQQQQQPLLADDLFAQQQHRERRASAYLFAIILIAWTITRFIDRFLLV